MCAFLKVNWPFQASWDRRGRLATVSHSTPPTPRLGHSLSIDNMSAVLLSTDILTMVSQPTTKNMITISHK